METFLDKVSLLSSKSYEHGNVPKINYEIPQFYYTYHKGVGDTSVIEA